MLDVDLSTTEGIPAMRDGAKSKSGNTLMKYGMWVCCAVMLLPVVWYFAAGGTYGGLSGKIAAFAPLFLCVGAHLLMFKLMGKSCHGESDDARTADERVADARRGGIARAVK